MESSHLFAVWIEVAISSRKLHESFRGSLVVSGHVPSYSRTKLNMRSAQSDLAQLVHDLKSSLFAIQTTAEAALLEASLPPEIRDALDTIIRELRHSTEIANHVARATFLKQ